MKQISTPKDDLEQIIQSADGWGRDRPGVKPLQWLAAMAVTQPTMSPRYTARHLRPEDQHVDFSPEELD
jgi:hypothetical protein